VITAARQLHETAQERDEESGYVINAPIGTAMAVVESLHQIKEMMDSKSEAVEDVYPKLPTL
jgi:hypothetical protein